MLVHIVIGIDLNSIKTDMEGVAAVEEANEVTNVMGIVVNLIRYAGTGIALIVITMLGIKYMLASPAEKADVKKQIEPILIGCVLLFAGSTIVTIIASLVDVIG